MKYEWVPPPPKPPNSLAKLATIFAVVFCIAFGLCTASVFTGLTGSTKAVATIVIYLSLATEAICLLGLIAVALLAIVRSFRRPKP